MEFYEAAYIENRGTKFEEEESITILRVQHSYGNGGYFILNPHLSEGSRMEFNTEEIDALLEVLRWAKEHPFEKPNPDPLADYVEVVRPGDGGSLRADDPHPVEEDG